MHSIFRPDLVFQFFANEHYWPHVDQIYSSKRAKTTTTNNLVFLEAVHVQELRQGSLFLMYQKHEQA